MPPAVVASGMRTVPATNAPYPMRKVRTVVRSRAFSPGTLFLATAPNPPLGHLSRIQNPVELLLGKDLLL